MTGEQETFGSDPRARAGAVAAFRAGDKAAAERLAREALRQVPDDAAALQVLGAIVAERGDWAEAVACFEQAAAAQPGNAGARFGLAEARRRSGDRDGAVAALEAVLEIAPDHVPALVTLARLLSGTPRAADALALLDRAVSRAPDDPRARLARADARMASGRGQDALDDLRAACAAVPDDAAPHLALGRALATLRRHDEADRALARALALQPALIAAHRDRGKLAMLRHDPAAAVAHYRQALALDDADPETHALIAQALNDLRRGEEAARHLGRALALQPANPTARLLDAQLLRAAGDAAGARDRLEALIEDGPPPELAGEALAELGHCLDRLGDTRRAFARFTEANAIVAGAVGPADPVRGALPARIAAMRRLADAAAGSDGDASDEDPAPVFVVGFPRSGTTLIEQVLAAHGDFVTSDEAPLIGRLARRVGGGDPAAIPRLGDAELSALRRDYRDAAEAQFPALKNGKRFVDKQPWNLIELPLIDRLFPRARILVMLRDPRDACLSAFMQYFALDPATLHLLTLPDTATLYARMMGLWLQRRGRLAAPHLEVRYEDLVRDFAGTTRSVLAFLGAPWRESVRGFAETARARAISTPSRDAVGRSLADRSIGRWTHYVDQMSAVLPILAPYVAAFGYDETGASSQEG